MTFLDCLIVFSSESHIITQVTIQLNYVCQAYMTNIVSQMTVTIKASMMASGCPIFGLVSNERGYAGIKGMCNGS